MLERCTRIWCVRPVPMRTSSRVKRVEAPQHAVLGPRRAALGQPRRHARAMHRVAGDGPLDAPALVAHAAVHQRQVGLLHLPSGELRGQAPMGRVVLGHQQHAAGVAVQAMHDARPQRAAHARERAEAMQQGVHQRSGMDARAGVHHHAGGLIDRHQVGVFIEHGEGDVFRQRPARAAARRAPRRWPLPPAPGARRGWGRHPPAPGPGGSTPECASG